VQGQYHVRQSSFGYHENRLYEIVVAAGKGTGCATGDSGTGDSGTGDSATRDSGTGDNGLMPEPWMIDELEHAGPEHLDPAFVAGYDRKQGYPDPAGDLAAFEAHGLDAGSVVVDLGAGTGQFALAAARRFRHVIAADVSPAMVAALRERSAAAGLANLDCVRAGFLSYRHSGPPPDGVYTRNALHQLPDFWKALALDRIARMLRPGGVLRLNDLIYDFGPAEAGQVFQRWLDHAAADPAGGYTSEDYAEHIRTEFSTFRWLLEPMLARAGFEIASADFARGLYGAYTCVKAPD
jgi:ubiquinone/menaquinone biosynthesis C-methylase UbiE